METKINPDKITPTAQDVELANEFRLKYDNPTFEGFAAWLRANYYVDAEHKRWF